MNTDQNNQTSPVLLSFGLFADLHYADKTYSGRCCGEPSAARPTPSGWPTSIELPDGSIITLYATTPYPIKDYQEWVSTTECVRWRLP